MGLGDVTATEDQPGQATILVVEDEPAVRLVAAEALRDAGFIVIEAATAMDALGVFATNTKISLVFTDVLMPGTFGGLSLASWLYTNQPDTPVILTSAITVARRYLEAQDGQVFLEKPYSGPDLVALVTRIIQHDRTS